MEINQMNSTPETEPESHTIANQHYQLAPLSMALLKNYSGLHRPQLHFSPPENFMNDPNGLFRDQKGIYHLYYQYNPTGLVAGNQHWGHATSDNLYHWTNQPIAIFPPAADSQVFSGSVVIDVHNTSGFFPNQTNGMVAIYTLNTPRAQVQEIAYSIDGGYTFERYSGNPVIDINSLQFRDPKVIWHEESKRWVMVIAHSQEFVISFYTSPGLKTWEHVSNFSHQGLLGLQYECPNLVRVAVRDWKAEEGPNAPSAIIAHMYVLTISINPGAPLGGSATQYFPGTFDGTHFTPVDGAMRLTDFAKDNYAGQFFYGLSDEEDAVSIAWASNWQYTESVPTAQEGWRSAMTLPRRHYLTNNATAGWNLVSFPVNLHSIRGALLAHSRDLVKGSCVVDYSSVESRAVLLETKLPSDMTFTFAFSSPVSGECVVGGFSGDFFLDRGRTNGFDNPFFTDKFSTSVTTLDAERKKLTVIIDRSIIEVFINDGAHSATATFFSTQPLTLLTLAASETPTKEAAEFAVYGLRSTWGGQ